MPSQSDVREITEEGRENKKKRFDKRDWDHIAEYVIEEFHRRQRNRRDREQQWDEIDRQIRMEPDRSFKLDHNGRPDKSKIWMSEMELPLQAQTLEVLTADARRMMFPDSGPWFRAHSLLSDDYLDRADFSALVAGDTNEVPTQIDQDAADKLVEGYLNHLFRQYDFTQNIDQINAEAFKYGVGVGRARMVRKSVYMPTARGVVKREQEIPVLVPRSIRRTYLDDSMHALQNEGHFVGPGTIMTWDQKLTDLIVASSRGSKDPDERNGGWMPKAVSSLEPRENGHVTLLEYEGDLVIPRKSTGSIYIPGACVTVAMGDTVGDRQTKSVVRFRFSKEPFTSYVLFPYHVEDLDTPYAAGPLMKGRPVQISATQALNRLLDSAALNVYPPINYSRDDAYFAAEGGPVVEPGAQWQSTDGVAPQQIGDPSAMLQAYSFLLQQYADLTGVNAPRLGQQTVSHTTAFAKQAELQRGTIRTVDYVRTAGHGPLTRWLNMAFEMGKKSLGRRTEEVYVDAYQSWVNVSKDSLPDKVAFNWHGSGGPQEEQARLQGRLQALTQAVQLDQFNIQQGNPPRLDVGAAIEELLREGGWIDVDPLLNQRGQAVEQEQNPAGVQAALQQIAGGGGQ